VPVKVNVTSAAVLRAPTTLAILAATAGTLHT
jgi:hypothetical protein